MAGTEEAKSRRNRDLEALAHWSHLPRVLKDDVTLGSKLETGLFCLLVKNGCFHWLFCFTVFFVSSFVCCLFKRIRFFVCLLACSLTSLFLSVFQSAIKDRKTFRFSSFHI